jgi:hypothetical protein
VHANHTNIRMLLYHTVRASFRWLVSGAYLSTMGDGIKVVLSFIPRETLNILTFIPRNPCMHRIKVRTLLNFYATLLLGAVRSRALNALGITII